MLVDYFDLLFYCEFCLIACVVFVCLVSLVFWIVVLLFLDWFCILYLNWIVCTCYTWVDVFVFYLFSCFILLFCLLCLFGLDFGWIVWFCCLVGLCFVVSLGQLVCFPLCFGLFCFDFVYLGVFVDCVVTFVWLIGFTLLICFGVVDLLVYVLFISTVWVWMRGYLCCCLCCFVFWYLSVALFISCV